MPEIEIRPAVSPDIPALVKFDHAIETLYVWQMERLIEETQLSISFREIRMPRPVRLVYPRLPASLADEWKRRTMVLVAGIKGQLVGYVALSEQLAPNTAWVTDLVVHTPHRRKGIGTGLLLAAQEWANQLGLKRMVLEMQSKNQPAVRLAMKMGFEFCGYHDHYYANQDIALFFAQFLR